MKTFPQRSWIKQKGSGLFPSCIANGVFCLRAAVGVCMLVFLLVLSLALGTASAKTAPPAEVTITLNVASGATLEMSRFFRQDLLDVFEKANPGIRIKFNPKNSWSEVYHLVLAGAKKSEATGVSVAEISDTLSLVDEGAVIPLDSLVQSQPGGSRGFLELFPKEFLENSYGLDRKMYAVPFIRSTLVAYFNMAILNKVGITIDTLPATWSEFEKVLERVHASTGDYPFALSPEWHEWIFESFVRQAGGALFAKSTLKPTFTTGAAVEALAFLKKLKDRKLMLTYERAWKSAINGFIQGRFPIIFYSTGGMESVRRQAKFPWMVERMPGNVARVAPLGAGNLIISKHLSDTEVKAAWKLVNFLLMPKSQALISLNSGYFPAITAAFDLPILKARYELEPFRRAKTQLSMAVPKMMTPRFEQMKNILNDAIDRSLNQSVAPEDSLRAAQEQALTVIGTTEK